MSQTRKKSLVPALVTVFSKAHRFILTNAAGTCLFHEPKQDQDTAERPQIDKSMESQSPVIKKAKEHQERLATKQIGISSEIDLTPSLIDRTDQTIQFNYDFDKEGYFEFGIVSLTVHYDEKRKIVVSASMIDPETIGYLERLVHDNVDVSQLRDRYFNKG